MCVRSFLQTSSKKTTTTVTTPAKIMTTTTTAADMKKYEDMDVDQLLSQLSPEEIQILAKEVDPDVSIWNNGWISDTLVHASSISSTYFFIGNDAHILQWSKVNKW